MVNASRSNNMHTDSQDAGATTPTVFIREVDDEKVYKPIHCEVHLLHSLRPQLRPIDLHLALLVQYVCLLGMLRPLCFEVCLRAIGSRRLPRLQNVSDHSRQTSQNDRDCVPAEPGLAPTRRRSPRFIGDLQTAPRTRAPTSDAKTPQLLGQQFCVGAGSGQTGDSPDLRQTAQAAPVSQQHL
eukprot:SAG31_NODE_6537_length_1984_cov_2.385676_2_plen_183_part_00